MPRPPSTSPVALAAALLAFAPTGNTLPPAVRIAPVVALSTSIPRTSLAVAITLPAGHTPAGPGPTVAREDTMFTQVPEVLVRAPRVTLEEILARVARGEARRESLIADQQFTATFRVVRGIAGSKPPELLSERVLRVYKKKPHFVRSVPLRQYDRQPARNATVELRFRDGMDEEIVNFAFRLEARRDYRYRIVGRDFVGGHLIYRIAFEPRSPLDPSQPSGTV